MTEETLEWLETQRRLQNGTLEKWMLEFYTDGFYVRVSGGEETKSVPSCFLEHIKDYSTVVVELFERGEPMTKEQKEKWESPITVGDFTINLNVHCFPHRAIYPKNEKFIMDQPWAEKFKETGAFATSAFLTLEELEIVMKYLVKLDMLEAFK